MEPAARWPAAHDALTREQSDDLTARVHGRAAAWAHARGLAARASELLALAVPMAGWLARRRRALDGPLCAGIAGAQGTGKSSLAELLALVLDDGLGLRTAVLSLDNLYLTRAERARLARELHPLLATRGVPGTHDVELGTRVLDALRSAERGARVRLPRFDKARDDRLPEREWPTIEGPLDCVLFEGWCVGARPEPESALAQPINALEREHDPEGVVRRYANAMLAGAYRALFDPLQLLIFLAAPDLQSSLGWRIHQEHELAARTGGAGLMSDAQIAGFVQHYERISRHMLSELPRRADVVLRLDPSHAYTRVDVR